MSTVNLRVPGTPPIGLTHAQAVERLESFGPNELPTAVRQGVLRILLRVLQEPMLTLLAACGFIYVFTGDPGEGLLLFASALIVIAITLYQEVKSERALEALRDLSSPRALVTRDGEMKRIPGREVVPGDLIHLSEGDRIPADALVLSSQHLTVDESALTGEAFSILKDARSGVEASSSEMARSLVFSGALVVGGQGTAEVTATGTRTELGKIGRSLKSAPENPTPLQQEVNRMIRVFSVFGIGMSMTIAVVYGITRGDWPRGILAGLAAAMSLLPEEFPVVLTVFLAMGAWRISRANVLTRRVAAIEALGSISTLCVDKTGTLTQNRMSVREATGSASRLEILRIASLACHDNPVDPMEKAIIEAATRAGAQAPKVGTAHVVKRYPLGSGLMAMSNAWSREGSPTLEITCKGAPEAVLQLCRASRPEADAVHAQVKLHASQGGRVLAVARAEHPEATALPSDPGDLHFELLGLVVLEDPIRPEVPAAIRECREAGIRVMMLTGDYPETARSIAAMIDLPGDVTSGMEIARLDDLKLREAVRRTSVFARVTPEQKLRIVTALRENGDRVAMTGDGVNDAPSLKWADIGVAMGGRGTDVAREASAIVLLDDRFTSMVEAIRLGRRIYDNLRKAVLFILSVHVPIAGLTILPVILGMPLLLLPAHIVFLELIIDPACTLVYEAEAEEKDVMKRPPRSKSARLIGLREFASTFLQGTLILTLTLFLYFRLLSRGAGEDPARTTAFVALILSNLGLILIQRMRTSGFFRTLRTKNRAFSAVATGSLLLLILVLTIRPIRSIFNFAPLSASELLLAIGTALASFLGMGMLDRLTRLPRKTFGSR